jgi:hypothetical protein
MDQVCHVCTPSAPAPLGTTTMRWHSRCSSRDIRKDTTTTEGTSCSSGPQFFSSSRSLPPCSASEASRPGPPASRSSSSSASSSSPSYRCCSDDVSVLPRGGESEQGRSVWADQRRTAGGGYTGWAVRAGPAPGRGGKAGMRRTCVVAPLREEATRGPSAPGQATSELGLELGAHVSCEERVAWFDFTDARPKYRGKARCFSAAGIGATRPEDLHGEFHDRFWS